MTRTWPGHRGVWALGALLVLLGVGTLSVAAAQSQQTDDAPLVLFSQMMPVFSSPRCVNCHGHTNPQTGTNHEGGQVDVPLNAEGNMRFDSSGACLECHTAAPPSWRLAPSHMSFVGKDPPALCQQLRTINGLADPAKRQSFLDHLNEDPLIALAFVGQGGIGPDSAFAPITPEPPPMSEDAFFGAAQRWLGDGRAQCGTSWNGTIKVLRTWKPRVYPVRGVVTEAASELRVTLEVVDGKATTDVHFTMHDFADSGTCENQPTYRHTSWVADGKGPVVHLQIYADEIVGVQLFFDVPEVRGIRHQEDRISDAVPPPQRGGRATVICKIVSRDEPYVLAKDFLGARGSFDKNDPDHLVGQEADVKNPDGTTTTTIEWDLRKGE